MELPLTTRSPVDVASAGTSDMRGLDGDASPLDVEHFIDRRSFSPYQWWIMIVCFMVIAADGFDTAAIGYVGPALAAQWGVSKLALGPLFSSALIGTVLGALIAGPLGDKYGRRNILLGSVLLFGVLTLSCAFATNIGQLMVLRFVTGIGLGAAMPNAITLLSEFSPERHRAILVNTMFCGFTLGSSSGGFTSAWLITDFSWPVIFVIGGTIPLVIALCIIGVPESIRFLVAKNRGHEVIRKTLSRIDRRVTVTALSFAVSQRDVGSKQSPIAVILSRRYRVGSLLFWLTYFMGLVVYLGLTTWLPTLRGETGLTMRQAAVITAVLSLGAGVGPLLLGWLMDRINPYFVVAGGFTIAAVLVWATGAVIYSASVVPWFIFATGVFLSGSITSMPTLAAAYYPTQGRASGVAWMIGIGRIGGIIGAASGGPLLNAGFSVGAILGFLAAPALLAACALLLKNYIDRSTFQPSVDGAVQLSS